MNENELMPQTDAEAIEKLSAMGYSGILGDCFACFRGMHPEWSTMRCYFASLCMGDGKEKAIELSEGL